MKSELLLANWADFLMKDVYSDRFVLLDGRARERAFFMEGVSIYTNEATWWAFPYEVLREAKKLSEMAQIDNQTILNSIMRHSVEKIADLAVEILREEDGNK